MRNYYFDLPIKAILSANRFFNCESLNTDLCYLQDIHLYTLLSHYYIIFDNTTKALIFVTIMVSDQSTKYAIHEAAQEGRSVSHCFSKIN